MRITAFILFICILFTFSLKAQSTFSGNITDQSTNEKLLGVSIYANDLKTGAITDEYGHFEIPNLKNGSYLFEISYLGYKTQVQKIDIKRDTSINFKLTEAIKELSEIVVTGVTRSTELKINPISIKTVDHAVLSETSSSNLIDALKNIPGVDQITTGAAISKPIIRGLGYNRVLTLVDGIRQEGQQWGDEHGIEIDQYTVDRVEIIKGPGSLMYGSDGIAGVLNFISPKAPSLNEIKSNITTDYQTNNNLIGTSISNAGNKYGFQWMGRLTHKSAGNYANLYDGKVYNSGFSETDGNIFLGINRNWGHTHFNFSTYNNKLGIVEGNRDSSGAFTFTNGFENIEKVNAKMLDSYDIGIPYQQVNHLRFSSNSLILVKGGTINADFGFQNNKRREFGDPTMPQTAGLYFDLNTFNYNIRYNLAPKNAWETSIGFGGMQQKNTNKGNEFIVPAYNLFDAGVFVFTQKSFQNLTLAGGIRYDQRWLHSNSLILDSLGTPVASEIQGSSLKFKSFSNSFEGFSGSVGLSYQFAKSTLKFNISRGYRAPNIAELASNGNHEGTFKYEIGDINLKSEQSNQFDLSYFMNSDHISLEVSPYINMISNYIYAEKLFNQSGQDSIPNIQDPVPAFKFTQGNAVLYGGEIYLDVHPHPLDWLHIENSFSIVHATQNNQADSTKFLPFIPAPKYRCEFKAQFKSLGSNFSNLFLRLGVDHYFAQNNIFSAFNTETATPAYTLWNAGMGTSITAFGNKNALNLIFGVENLADIAYQNHLSRLKYAPENLATGNVGVYNMGRNFNCKMVLNF